MKLKKIFLLILIVLLFIAGPVWLRFGNSGFNYDYGKEVEMIFSYLGDAVGGIATMIALVITVNQTREIQQENQNQVKINNINEKINDCMNLYDAINNGNTIISEIYVNYANKQLSTEDMKSLLKELSRVDDEILKVQVNPLMLDIGCDTNALKEEIEGIIGKIDSLIELQTDLTDTKYIEKIISSLNKNLFESSIKIKEYITKLYEGKYKKLVL